MSIERMADRTLPLAGRVTAAYLVGIQVADGDENGQDARAALDSLRSDIAAADRLARACLAYDSANKAYWSDETETRFKLLGGALDDSDDEYDAALDAYRDRMAQGVARG